MPQRTLSESEFNTIKASVLDALPSGLSEAEFQRVVGPKLAQAIGEAESLPAKPEWSSVGRFVSNAASMLNPVAAVEGLYGAVTHPVDTIVNIGGAMADQGTQAIQAAREGRSSEAIGHGIAAVVPVVGPAAAHAGEQIASGDVAGGLGTSAGLLAPALAMPAVRAAGRVVGKAAGVIAPTQRELVLQRLEGYANKPFAEAMTPTGSSKEIRTLGKQAAKVAGDVREGTTAVTPSGLRAQIADHLEATSAKLDDAYDAIPKNVGHSTGPILSKLQAAKQALYVEGTGGKVLPAAKADRAAALTQAIQEVKQLGPFTNTDNLAKLRNNWKELAKDQFVPNVNPNFKQIQGAAKGWADAYTQLQDHIVTRHSELQPLNADYHIWKTADDVMTALEDRERVRPTVGRTILSSGVGFAAKGAIGAVVAPLIERGITANVAPAVKLTAARGLASIATLIKGGAPPAAVNAAVSRLKPTLLKLVAQEATVQGATSPSESQTQPAGALP